MLWYNSLTSRAYVEDSPMHDMIADFLVIGSGVAGLRAAVELSRHGKVIVATKDIPTESNTEYAQGGVAVALSDEDMVGIHLEDTLNAGAGLCREDAVRVLVQEGPDRIRELIDWGAAFDKEGAKLVFSMEGAHSRKRILHAHGDSTGKELIRVLISKAMSLPNIERFPFSMALDLIVEDGFCRGAYVLQEGNVYAIYAKAVVLATGGAGQVFSRTTNPAVATGDGLAIAFRAGAVLEDMEFVQFHPTALFASAAPQFLLSEAMRGEGAILRDVRKEPFMKEYHPMAELAPRDIVSRAIMARMVQTQSSYVYLDLTHLDGDFVKRRFPRIYTTCLQYDIDITKYPIPVSPAAHYLMGGVKTDLNGATTVTGLYAAGEVACTGVHGANRLASNSLLEGLVYGFRAARKAGEQAAEAFTLKRIGVPSRVWATSYTMNIEEIRTAVRRTMWEHVGITRSEDSLKAAFHEMEKHRDIMDRDFNSRRGLELKNIMTVAHLIAQSAISRKGSVGAHYRSDFMERGADGSRHYQLRKDDHAVVTTIG
ncbi:MAG: L-aspartate oxidase [Nitrospirae bacterium]|nr:MAG: L-aspartate oxidase [Nitrospirota bacterium]